MENLTDKFAIVTGSSRGIGRASAEESQLRYFAHRNAYRGGGTEQERPSFGDDDAVMLAYR